MNVYCNDGFTVIEELVSAVTGMSFARFVEDEVFAPLGMAHSRYPIDYFPFDTFAQRYSGTTRAPQLFLHAFASGGLFSTPTDMAKIAIMLIGKGKIGETRFLSRKAVAAMGVDQTADRFNPAKSYAYSYGLGLDSVLQPGLRAVRVKGWHKGGDVTLYGSAILVAPRERLAAVVMGASGSFDSKRATIIAERILLRALAEKGRIPAMPAPLNPQILPERTPSPGLVASVKGYYGLNSGLLHIDESNNSLNISVWNTSEGKWADWKTGLRLRKDGRFASDADPGTAFSFKTAQRRRYLVMRSVGGYGHYQDDSVFAEQIAAPEDLPSPWKNRLAKKWLLANEHPEGPLWAAPLLRLRSMDDHLFVDNAGVHVVNPSLGDSVAGMMLLIPQMNGRDLNDAVVETREGEEWIRFGSYLFRPGETIKKLNTEGDAIAIGPEGYAEWRLVEVDAEKTLSIVTSGPWRLFDGNFAQADQADGTKTVTLAAGTYYMAFLANATIDSFPVQELQAMLDASVSDDGLPGAILAVRTPAGSWVGAAGKASLASGEPMTPDMQVRLASVTKSLTSILVMKLVEANLLSLHDTVEKWLPGLIPGGEQMTVKMLLSHRAGIYSVTELESFWVDLLKDPLKSWTSDEIIERVRSLTPLFTPGTEFVYTNTGYYVLGLIVEAATGNTLEAEIGNLIFGPQGLARTRLTRHGFMDAPMSHGHTWLPTTEQVTDNTDWNLSWDWTAGAAVSTGADMLKLATSLFSGQIVNPITLELMITPTEPGGYGLGIGAAPLFGTTCIGHSGQNPGTVTYWYHFPDRDTTIFVAANRSDTLTKAPPPYPPINANALAFSIFEKAWQILYP